MPRYIVMFLLLCSFLLFNCSKDDDDCGCNGPTESVIEESDDITGQLFLVDEENPNAPQGMYMIRVDISGQNFFYDICNSSAIRSLQPIPETDGITVDFSGKVKNPCDTPIGPAIHTFKSIIITTITKR